MVATSTILLIMWQMGGLTIVGGIAAVMAITGMQEEEEYVRRVQVVGCEVAEERVWAAAWVRLTVG